jgi:hypothetical protein
VDLFSGRRTIQPEQADRIKDWTREVFHLNDKTTVMVTELECREPGCPPVETVIAVLEGPGRRRQYKIHTLAADVSRSDVERLVEEDEQHHAH